MKSFDKKITIIDPNKLKKKIKFAFCETGIALRLFKASIATFTWTSPPKIQPLTAQ